MPSVSVAENGQLCALAVGAQRRKIDNFNAWLEVFALSARFKSFYHPDIAMALLAYQNIIQGMVLHLPLNF